MNQSFHLPHAWVDSRYIIRSPQIHGVSQSGFESTSWWLLDELMAVMTLIWDVRLNTVSVPELFGLQRDCVQVLWRYGVDVLNDTVASRTVQNVLGEAPRAWEAVVKKTFKKKEEIFPMQMASVDALKSLTWTNFTFQSGNSVGTSELKLRLSSKAVVWRRLK